MNITDMRTVLTRVEAQLLTLAGQHHATLEETETFQAFKTAQESLTVNSADSARALISGLDSDTRGWLLDALEAARTRDRHDVVVATVRGTLLEQDRRPVTLVAFSADDTMATNGFFLHQTATVYYTDGTTDDIDFGSDVLGVLNDQWGAVGPDFTVTVDPTTGEVNAGDNLEPPDGWKAKA